MEISGYEAAKSHYVLYEDRTDDQTVVASSNFSTQLNENLIMNAGGSLRNLKSHNYQLFWTCWAEPILRILMVLWR
jgi:hypothetical protein